jgi:hypothetical protein
MGAFVRPIRCRYHVVARYSVTKVPGAPRRRSLVLELVDLRNELSYCGKPSTVKARNFAYLSPIFLASLNSAELRQA